MCYSSGRTMRHPGARLLLVIFVKFIIMKVQYLGCPWGALESESDGGGCSPVSPVISVIEADNQRMKNTLIGVRRVCWMEILRLPICVGHPCPQFFAASCGGIPQLPPVSNHVSGFSHSASNHRDMIRVPNRFMDLAIARVTIGENSTARWGWPTAHVWVCP